MENKQLSAEDIIWKAIEGFQEMMVAEGLNRETDINDKHLSYNDVEYFLYELMEKVAPLELAMQQEIERLKGEIFWLKQQLEE